MSRMPGFRVACATFLALACLPDFAGAQGLGVPAKPERKVVYDTDRGFHALTPAAAKTWVKLAAPVALPFEQETPLADILKHIKKATAGPEDSGLPIFVDQAALQDEEVTMGSPFAIDVEGIPLATGLRLLLRQHNLRFGVQADGLIVIGTKQSFPPWHSTPVSEAKAQTWLKLGRRVDVPFEDQVSLGDLVKFLEGGKPGDDALSIYVDPTSLSEHDLTLDKAVMRLQMKGVPLRTALGLMLTQMDLAFHVQKDGILIIHHQESGEDLDDEDEGELSDKEILARDAEQAQLRLQARQSGRGGMNGPQGGVGGGYR